MTNAQIIESMVSKLSKKIEWAMTEIGETYAQAKARVMRNSCAGSSVWAALDAKYA